MMGETGPMGLHSKGRKTDMKTAAKRERKTLRIVELALLLGAAAFLMTGVWALNTQRDLADKVVRLHVLANSDTEEDQALKLLVRDAVLERATEILEQSADRAEAEIRLRESLPELEAIAEETVRATGYDYAVTAELEDTAFPRAGDGPGRWPDGRPGQPDDGGGWRLPAEIQGRGAVGAPEGGAGVSGSRP